MQGPPFRWLLSVPVLWSVLAGWPRLPLLLRLLLLQALRFELLRPSQSGPVGCRGLAPVVFPLPWLLAVLLPWLLAVLLPFLQLQGLPLRWWSVQLLQGLQLLPVLVVDRQALTGRTRWPLHWLP